MAAAPPLRAALVGCGRIGAFTRPELAARLGPNWLPLSHADAIAQCDGVKLVACCDTDADAARRAARQHGDIGSYSDVKEMLEAEQIDILSIATRTDAREHVIREAVGANVPGIHSEKPLAFSIAQTEETIRPMKTAGTAFTYGALRRYMPVFSKLRDRIRDGAIGELRSITVRFGRGGLLWTHPHSVDLMCFLAGDPPVAWVQASLECESNSIPGNRTIDSDPVVLSGAVMFENGVVGTIVPEPGLGVDVAGTTGGISVVGDGEWTLARDFGLARDCRPLDNWCFDHDESTKSGRLLAFERLRDEVLSGSRDERVFDRILEQHGILFAFAQSHFEGGRRVSLDNVDKDLSVTGRANGLVA